MSRTITVDFERAVKIRTGVNTNTVTLYTVSIDGQPMTVSSALESGDVAGVPDEAFLTNEEYEFSLTVIDAYAKLNGLDRSRFFENINITRVN